ncbi:MAG: hypothetical protein ACRELY_10970, partial [Polyangiaceae bacterium]
STDVCTQAPGAYKDEQDDGDRGIDNSFAYYVAPIGFDLGADYWSSATITLVSESGAYELDVVNPYTQFAIPVLAPRLVMDASGGGTLVGRIPAEQLIDSAALDGFGLPDCSPSARDAIAVLIRDGADLLLDGTNAPGATCDAISLGMTFSALTPVAVPVLKSGRCTEVGDGGVDQ